MIWRNAATSQQVLPDPTNFGYERDASDQLQPRLMNQPFAAPELMHDLTCNCQASTCHTDCTCFTNEQPCTSACSCSATLPLVDVEDNEDYCTNPVTITSLIDIDSDSDSDDINSSVE